MSINFKVECDDLTTFKIKIDNKKSNLNSKIKEAIEKSTLSIQREARNNLKNNGSVDTGHLRRSIGRRVSYTEGEVHTSNVKYAIYVEKGTKPHVIRPRRKKYLYWEGASHPVKKVNHPGTEAKPYLIPAFKKEKPEFIKRIQKLAEFDDD